MLRICFIYVAQLCTRCLSGTLVILYSVYEADFLLISIAALRKKLKKKVVNARGSFFGGPVSLHRHNSWPQMISNAVERLDEVSGQTTGCLNPEGFELAESRMLC